MHFVAKPRLNVSCFRVSPFSKQYLTVQLVENNAPPLSEYLEHFPDPHFYLFSSCFHQREKGNSVCLICWGEKVMVILKEAEPQSVLLFQIGLSWSKQGSSEIPYFKNLLMLLYIFTILNFENMIHFIIQWYAIVK